MTAVESGGTHAAYPGAFFPRMFIPRDPRAARVAKSFFLGWRTALKYRIQSVTKRDPGLYQIAPLFSEMAGLLALEGDLAVAAGTPGPYNKAAILFLDPFLRPKAVGKFAVTPAAVELARCEAAWLRRLDTPAMRDRTPSLLGFAERDGKVLLAQSVLSGAGGSPRLGHDQVAFVRDLHDLGRCSLKFAASGMAATLVANWARAEAMAPIYWKARIGRAFRTLEKQFSKGLLAVGPAHRDFAPWNVRVGRAGLSVFDWEYAADEYVLLYDLLHYTLAPWAVGRRASASLTASLAALEALLRDEGVEPEYLRAIPTQALAYLLDVVLFYAASWSQWNDQDKVVERYGSFIDQLLDPAV